MPANSGHEKTNKLVFFNRASINAQHWVCRTKTNNASEQRHNTDIAPYANCASSGQANQYQAYDDAKCAINAASVTFHFEFLEWV